MSETTSGQPLDVADCCIDLDEARGVIRRMKRSLDEANAQLLRLAEENSKMLEDLRFMEGLIADTPEIDECDYNNEDVLKMNGAMCELHEVVKKYSPNPRADGRGDGASS